MIDPISLAGIGFALLTGGALFALHFRRVEVPRVGRWKIPPNVYLHPGSPVTERELFAALRYWEGLGFEFGGVIITHIEPPSGAIAVTIPNRNWTENSAGRAWWTVLDDRAETAGESNLEDVVQVHPTSVLITAARVVIDSSLSAADRTTALRHELGHALGFRHARTEWGPFVGHPTGHVMHPQLAKCGTGYEGIAK
jgi:hypothetical protein